MNYWEKLWKNTLTIVVKRYFTKRNSFTKVMWWLQNSDLPLLQFDVRQKCGQRVPEALNCKNHAKNIWGYIWTTAGKICFTNIISFTKVTWSSENSDLQLLQFDIPSKCMNRVSKVLKHTIHSEEPWKYIWTTAIKIFFLNYNSFAKVMWLLRNGYLQSSQFVIRQKYS